MICFDNYQITTDSRHLFTIDKFRFKEGRIYLISGENGVGKSTFFNAIVNGSGQGTLEVDGQIIYQPQNPYLYRRNIFDNFKLCDIKITEASRLTKRMGLNKNFNTPVNQLSGGEKQKVIFIRSILRANEILLLDEPFTEMDKPGKENGLLVLAEWVKAKARRLILITSHDIINLSYIDEVLEISNQSLIFKER